MENMDKQLNFLGWLWVKPIKVVLVYEGDKFYKIWIFYSSLNFGLFMHWLVSIFDFVYLKTLIT